PKESAQNYLRSEDSLKQMHLDNSQKLVYEIVDDIFEQRKGQYEQSDSLETSNQRSTSSKSIVDKRLHYWKNMIRQRRALQGKLMRSTGKMPEDMLFNRDNREQQTLNSILAKATQNREPHILELGARSPCVEPVQMCVPESKLHEFVGYRSNPHSIMSMQPSEIINPSERSKPLISAPSQLALVINNTTYKRQRPEFSPILERKFVCNPYERILRTVMRLENLGRDTIRFNWMRAEFFAYNQTLFDALDDEFIFDTEPFMLRPGEAHEVSVLFRPRKVCIVKQRWLLTTQPRIFFRYPCALTLNMHGQCTPPAEYSQHLKRSLRTCYRRCPLNLNLIYPELFALQPVCYCPSSRDLDEHEAFNERNLGYSCQRNSDMQQLKQFFERVKQPHLRWDYSISMLRELVCHKSSRQQRIALLAELHQLLATLSGKSLPLSLCDAPAKVSQRQRSCFVFVRGILANSFELWLERLWQLETKLLKEQPGIVRRSKSLRDSMYMYTYDYLCNIMEDIVSAIESSEAS
ncbi:CG30385, partial [Drosophila busckii]